MKQTEHRSAARKPFNLPAEYAYPAGTGLASGKEAVTLNLSERGALIRSKVLVQVITDDVISLSLGLDQGKVTMEGRVARVVPNATGTCDIGVVFRNLSAENEYILARQLASKSL
jgi:hypothetical protein